MGTCICDNCYHLKEEEQNGGVVLCSCEYGFPDDKCENCDGADSCDLTCEFFDEISETKVVCAKCGKEISIYSKPEDGPYYCANCYLEMEL